MIPIIGKIVALDRLPAFCRNMRKINLMTRMNALLHDPRRHFHARKTTR